MEGFAVKNGFTFSQTLIPLWTACEQPRGSLGLGLAQVCCLAKRKTEGPTLYLVFHVIFIVKVISVGLDQIGHMSFLTGQDRTPKFSGQFLPDRTKSGLPNLPDLYL